MSTELSYDYADLSLVVKWKHGKQFWLEIDPFFLQDLEILNKGLSSNLTTCVQQAEQAERRSSDALHQLKKVTSVRLLLCALM